MLRKGPPDLFGRLLCHGLQPLQPGRVPLQQQLDDALKVRLRVLQPRLDWRVQPTPVHHQAQPQQQAKGAHSERGFVAP